MTRPYPLTKSRHFALAALMMTLFITSCFTNPTRFTQVPTAIPAGIEFSDRDVSHGLRGMATILPADDGQTGTSQWTFDSYVVRWAVDGVPQPYSEMGESNIIAQVSRSSAPLQFEINRSQLPAGVNSIVVYTNNALGSATEGYVYYFENLYVNPLVPQNLPASVIFSDTDTSLRIGGSVYFSIPAAGPNGISFYTIRYADAAGCPLDGPSIKTVYAVNRAIGYTVSLGASALPPSSAHSITVIPGNYYGDAYTLDCAYTRSNTETFNSITPTDRPYYQSARVTFTDTDESSKVSGTLTIYPSIDERDLSTGYYLEKVNTGTNTTTLLRYFPKNGQAHTYQVNGESRFAMYRVSTGKTPTDSLHYHDITFSASNIYGSWYNIKNKSSNTCIRADSASAALTMVACDESDPYQRFTATNTTWSDDPNNDDYFNIQSVAFPGSYFNRPYTAEGAWVLGPLSDNWSRILLRSFGSGEIAAAAVNKEWKKMAVVNNVAGIFHYACASMYFSTLQSPWSNCSGVLAGSFGVRTDFLEWKFIQPNGTVSKFNDL